MRARLVIIIGIYVLFLPGALYSQSASEVLGPEVRQEIPWITAHPSGARADRDTITLSPTVLLVDDFSKGNIPDSNLWYLGADRYPLIRKQAAISPLSFGTATFDGISPLQKVYSPILGRGPADRLETHYIDLSAQDPDNELYLSFSLQRQGYGHGPISKDSFKVYFNVLENGLEREVKVYVRSGNGNSSSFETVGIPIQEQRFFHQGFYIAFENEGLLNGMLSNWQLDYIAIGVGRTADDTLFNDRTMVGLDRSIFAPYTAIPFMQYQPNTATQNPNLSLRDLSGISGTFRISTSITDPVGNNLPSSYNGTFTQPFNAASLYQVPIGILNDNQTLNTPYASTFRQTIKLTGNTDFIPGNDELTYDYRIDSLFACDDGEADVAYGLNRRRGFGQKYTLAETDSLMAVWIHFVPQIDYIFGGSLNGKTFSLAIWTSPNEDSILYEEAFRIAYGDTADHFERYLLSTPISVKGDIWVGIIQNDNTPLGVGMDRTWDNDSLIAWDSSGVWVNSRFQGSLMIRPELRNIQFNPLPPPASIEDAQKLGNFLLYPNPGSTRTNTRWKWEGAHYQAIKLTLFDLQGRIVWSYNGTGETSGSLPILPPGSYYLRQTIKTARGWHQQSRSIQVLP